MADLSERDQNRPYPPAINVVSILQRIRSRNLPDRIDTDYLLDAGIASSLVHRVLFALRFLELVDGETPSATLRTIAMSTDEEYQSLLADLLRSTYQDVFSVVDPAHDSPERILNYFRRFKPASQRERMVNFFLAMCREAGIETVEVPKGRGSVPTSVKNPNNSRTPRSSPKRSSKAADTTLNNSNDTALLNRLPAPILILFNSLPDEGTSMSEQRRKQWLVMAEATLAFAYPSTDEDSLGNAGNDDRSI